MNDFNKILSAEQTRAADAFTIENEPIASIDLMERASEAFVNAILPEIDKGQTIHVFCGCGNNGGDGFAVARMLKARGFKVKSYLVKFSNNLSKDCEINYSKIDSVEVIESAILKAVIKNESVVIDAIFGSGLTRVVDNPVVLSVFEVINSSGAQTISIDCPSGLFCDTKTPSKNIIEADITISFQRPKLSFFMPGYGDFVNNWKAVDIGLNEDFIQSQESDYYYLDERVYQLLKPRKKFSHKGTYGHALLIAGSYGKMGAAVLASKACLEQGVGLLTTHIPKCGYEIIQISVPKAMCTVDNNYEHLAERISVDDYSAIGIGPGIGKHEETKSFVRNLLENAKKPLVIDADALNIIAEDKLHSIIPKNSILTPHPKEFERLFGKTSDSFEQLELARKKAIEYHVIIVLKGAHTAIINVDGKVYFNTTGSPKLAQAGSGDRLTGYLSSYLAQKYSSLESAIIGVYLHGKHAE